MAAPKGNKYAIGNKGGRPPKYKDAAHMAREIDAYFEWIKGEKKREMRNVYSEVAQTTELKEVEYWIREPEHPTVFGLLLYLGFCSLQAFSTYMEKDEEFQRTILRAKARVMCSYEKRLGSRETVRGSMFMLQAMGVGGRTEITYYGKDGKPVDPPSQQIITNVMPNTNTDI